MRENGWRNRYAQIVSADNHEQVHRIGARPAETSLFELGLLFTAYLRVRAIIGDEMTIGAMVTFLACRASFVASATALVDHGRTYRLMSVHIYRLSDIVSTPRENVAAAAPRGVLLPAPSIRAEKLSFSHPPNDPPILRELDYEILAGSFAAILGPSGAGKTTLTRIMLRLLTPTRGGG